MVPFLLQLQHQYNFHRIGLGPDVCDLYAQA